MQCKNLKIWELNFNLLKGALKSEYQIFGKINAKSSLKYARVSRMKTRSFNIQAYIIHKWVRCHSLYPLKIIISKDWMLNPSLLIVKIVWLRREIGLKMILEIKKEAIINLIKKLSRLLHFLQTNNLMGWSNKCK